MLGNRFQKTDLLDTIKGKTILSFEVANATVAGLLQFAFLDYFLGAEALPSAAAQEGPARQRVWGALSLETVRIFLGLHNSACRPPPGLLEAPRAGRSDRVRRALSWCDAVPLSPSSRGSFSRPDPRGTMTYPHFLGNASFLAQGFPRVPSLTSTSHSRFREVERLHGERQSLDQKHKRAKKHRKHAVLLGGLEQLQEALWKGSGQPPALLSLPPGARVCSWSAEEASPAR